MGYVLALGRHQTVATADACATTLQIPSRTAHVPDHVYPDSLWHVRTSSSRCRASKLSLSSGLIQIADTYLHIVIDAVSAVQLIPAPTIDVMYGRRLAPWCYDAGATEGTSNNMNFWSCGIEVNEDMGMTRAANGSLFDDVTSSINSYTMNYTNADGVRFILLRAPEMDVMVDWRGSGYGISTQCTAIPEKECVLGPYPNMTASGMQLQNFSCTSTDARGKPFSGKMSNYALATYFDDFHRYVHDMPPFTGQYRAEKLAPDGAVENATAEDAKTMFSNPWHFLASSYIMEDLPKLPQAFKDSPIVWKGRRSINRIMPYCNSTGESTPGSSANVTLTFLQYGTRLTLSLTARFPNWWLQRATVP